MGWFTGIAVYVVVWWTVLFTVLPWGVRPPAAPGPGHAAGAPDNPRMGLKALITTAIAAVVWVAIYLVIESGAISVRETG
ncbi:MAG: DUF1467 family protein [Pseudomonadota bacterium]